MKEASKVERIELVFEGISCGLVQLSGLLDDELLDQLLLQAVALLHAPEEILESPGLQQLQSLELSKFLHLGRVRLRLEDEASDVVVQVQVKNYRCGLRDAGRSPEEDVFPEFTLHNTEDLLCSEACGPEHELMW